MIWWIVFLFYTFARTQVTSTSIYNSECPANTYAFTNASSTYCLPCPANSFSSAGSTTCVPCADDSQSSVGFESCVYNGGYDKTTTTTTTLETSKFTRKKKISDFKVIYISPDHNEKYHQRKEWVHDLLVKLGFTDITHYKSCTNSYPFCLTRAFAEILTIYIDEEILVVEDDIGWSGIDTIDDIEHADAIYFGYSRHGGHPSENIHYGASQFEPYSQSMVRVKNILTAHAILFKTRRYKQAIIDSFTQELNYYNDVKMSRLQPHFLVYAPKSPIFFQSSRFYGPEFDTNFRIQDDMTITYGVQEVIP